MTAWRASFVATSVALGIGVDDALAALGPAPSPAAGAPTDALVAKLRAPNRATRAAALAAAVHGIALAVDGASFR